jgi:hypothetical protein
MPGLSDEQLANIIAPVEWSIPPVITFTNIDALPKAAAEREVKKAVDSFASTGRNLFVHFTTPVLNHRRELLLRTGATKKKYPKTAAQLWQGLDYEETFYWEEMAREVRMSLKQKLLTAREYLTDAGRKEDRRMYVWHAEVAVATYLGLPQPPEPADAPLDLSKTSPPDHDAKEVGLQGTITTTVTAEDDRVAGVDLGDTELLDTLPDPFTYEPRMMYSHFARYNFDAVRNAVGKHQRELLHQLAGLFEKTGKVLFYYYTIPHLCKKNHPPTAGETVTSQAADLWRFLPGKEKEKWLAANVKVKKMLGDGNLDGLETLMLESLDPEVLKLHDMARFAIGSGSVEESNECQ